MSQDQNIIDQAAERLIKEFGERALEVSAKRRDQNSWGTFSYSFGNQICKAVRAKLNEAKQ